MLPANADAQANEHRAPGHPLGLAIGQLRRQRRLGSEAVYRVREVHGELVEVEVVGAPGLEAGGLFTFTRQAVERMELVSRAE
jgi:hypothetical protein